MDDAPSFSARPEEKLLSDLLILEPSSQDSPIFRADSTKIMKFMKTFTKNSSKFKIYDLQLTSK